MPRRGERSSERLVSQSQDPSTRNLKQRPGRAAQRGAAAISTAPSSDSELTATGSDSELPIQYTGRAAKAAQLVGGDDIDSDQPVKRTRLSLARAVTIVEDVEDDDTDGTSLTDVGEDSDGQELDAVIDRLSALEKADAEAKAITSDETPSFLRIPEDTTPRASPSPARRGGKQQRGGRGNGLLRGRLPGTPRKGNTRAGSQVRQSPAVIGANGILDRLPGRRRAHHADIDIEVDLRRQLELRVGYRALAKALKPILAELAARTLRDLESDEELHKQCPEYQQVLDDLDERLKSRLAYINSEHDLEEQRLHRAHIAQVELTRHAAKIAIEHSQDTAMLLAQFNFMHSLRNVDQDKRVKARRLRPTAPRIKNYEVQHSAPHHLPRQSLYVSELRHMTDTAFHWDKFEDRIDLALAQRRFDQDSFQLLYDNDALTKEEREELEEATGLLDLLTGAAAEVEHPRPRRVIPAPIPNSAAIGLNALADAISMMKPVEVIATSKQDVPMQAPAVTKQSVQPDASHSVELKPQTPPPATTTKTSPVTPRTQPFKPSIASIINAEPLEEAQKPALKSTPARYNTGESLQCADELTRRVSVGTSTKTSVKKSVAVELLNPDPRPHPPLPQNLAAKASGALGQDVPRAVEAQPVQAHRPGSSSITQAIEGQARLMAEARLLPPIRSQLPPHLQPHLARSTDFTTHSAIQPHPPPSFYPHTQASQQALHDQMHQQASQIQMTFEPPKRVRKRPGPRAIFTKQTQPDIPGSSQVWSPFANAMGPPTYIPKYVKENELVRRGSDSAPESTDQTQQNDARPGIPSELPSAYHSRDNSGGHGSRPSYGPSEGHRVDYQAGDITRPDPSSATPNPVPPLGTQPWNQNLYYNSQTHYGPSPPVGYTAPSSVSTPSKPGITPPEATAPPSHERRQSVHTSSEGPVVPQYRPGNSQSRSNSASDRAPHLPNPGPSPANLYQREAPSIDRSEIHSRSSILLPRLAPQNSPPGLQQHHSFHGPVAPREPPSPHNFHYRSNSMNSAQDREARRQLPAIENERHSRDTRPTSPPERRTSQVPLLTPTAQPLPSYRSRPLSFHLRKIEEEVSAIYNRQAPSENLHRTHEPPIQRPSLPRDISSLTSVIQINKAEDATRSLPADAPPPAAPDTNTAPTSKKATPRTALVSTTQPVTSTQSFKGQRPKHSEWRNWSTARPPPSAGATDSGGGVSVPTMLPSTNGPSTPTSTRNRKKRAKSSQVQGEDNANGVPSQVQQIQAQTQIQQAPTQTPALQYGLPQKEWRFESVNKKFEGAGRGPEK